LPWEKVPDKDYLLAVILYVDPTNNGMFYRHRQNSTTITHDVDVLNYQYSKDNSKQI